MSSDDREPYLRIARVEKVFGSFRAVDDVSLDIRSGELVCFLGPSGCGKTTLLRAIAGLDIQTSGRILQAGRDISALPPSERDFGIVFQSYALFPNLTVTENIGYGLKNRRTSAPEIAARVAELLALVGLGDQRKKYPAQLSGGQQQRVALARALATSPGLLLLDEPLSALDARVRVHLRQEIRQLQRRLGITTIMVTHDQEEALVMADRIAVLNQGRLEQLGTPTEIYRTPASAFVADFIGRMNFLPAQLAGSDRVRVGEAELAYVRPANGHAGNGGPDKGRAVFVCVRPEDIVVRGVEPGAANALSAAIADMEFLGSYVRTQLTSAKLGNARLMADLSINAVRDLDLGVGKPVTVALPPDRIRIFDAESHA